MKKIMILAVDVLLVMTSIAADGQDGRQANDTRVTFIRPYSLSIGCMKTTNLVFPCAIKSVDRGSGAVLVRKAAGVDNILQVKGAKPGFEPTNLTVITADGRLYSCLLHYSPSPARLNLVFGKGGSADSNNSNQVSGPALFPSGEYNQAELVETAARVARDKRSVYGIRDKSYGMTIRLEGIYILHGVLYYRVFLQNRSNIGYDIEGFRFSVQDRHRYKRTASQEIEIRPVYVLNDTSRIRANSSRMMVFALPKFTFSRGKYMLIRLSEKNGGRNLELRVHERAIMKAKPVPENGSIL